jgi:glycosyltransferase involved in cell wall biosynthesis
MTKDTPIDVTVLMPVFNGELYLKEAMESILNQTFSNFELLIINDGSSDSSHEIICSFDDDRIVYINNKTNQGIVAALNEGLRLSRGKYIARMDADDMASLDRLEVQYRFLAKNTGYKLCGTNAIAINSEGKETAKIRRPHIPARVKALQLFRNAFIHPTIMADAEVMKSFGYAKAYEYAEDYLLFSQIAMHHKVINLNYNGIKYRIHNESISAKKRNEMVQSEIKTERYLLSFLFNEVSDQTLNDHHLLLRPKQNIDAAQTHSIEAHLLSIKNANREKQIFEVNALEKQLLKEWYEILKKSMQAKKLNSFISSDLFSFRMFNLKQFIKLLFA